MEQQINVEIGKYTLESLTTGMYSEPKIVYREYIQNSVDALETAVNNKIIEKQSMRIDIIVDAELSKITIRDNGIGIESEKAASTLLNIGNSQKRQSNNRGFRGIGRLGGMSYCDILTFTTSYPGENKKTIVRFDCKKLRALLVPGAYEQYNLSKVLEEITSIKVEEEKEIKHYFQVDMEDVSDFSDLLSIEKVREYVAQVAPVTYSTRHFYYASEVHKYLSQKNTPIEEFPIFMGSDYENLEPVYKPNKYHFHSDRNKKKADEIDNIIYFDVVVDDECYAVGWYADCNWYGSISESDIAGIRVRKGNILIGDSKTLNSVFRESRFNGWVQGELYVITDKLIPNARRDDFEQNTAYFKMMDCLQNTIGTDISRLIREASGKRNDISAKVIKEVEKTVAEAKKNLEEGFNSSIDKEKLVEQLVEKTQKLSGIKVRDDLSEKKETLIKEIEETVGEVQDSKNYKINKINSGIDRKSKKILEVVSDILSEKLSKFLVDEIIDEIIKELNRK